MVAKPTKLEFEVDYKPLLRKLGKFPEAIQRQVLLDATKRATQMQQRVLKGVTPRQFGALAASWRVKRVRYRVRGTFGFKVRPNPKYARLKTLKGGKAQLKSLKESRATIKALQEKGKKPQHVVRPSKYAHLVEWGHVMRREKGGATSGKVKGRFFATRVLQDTMPSALKIFRGKVAAFLKTYRA